jgi:hypothetical protein
MSIDTNQDFSEQLSAVRSEGPSGESQDKHDGDIIWWIPIVVPLFAVLIASCVYFINWGVLVIHPWS